MKEFTTFYLGDRILWQGETRHIPSEGHWITLESGLYIAAKVHYIYSSAGDRADVDVLLAPVSAEWICRLKKAAQKGETEEVTK